MLFGFWLNQFLETFKRAKLKDSTYSSYIYACKPLNSLYSIPIQEITIFHLQAVFDAMAGYSTSTIKHTYTILKQSLDKAVACGYLPSHNLSCVEMPLASERKKVVALSDFEIAQLRNVLIDERGHYYNAFMFLLYSGLRIGELIALEHSDIDYSSGVISIHRSSYNGVVTSTKTVAGCREIPLIPDLIRLLKSNRTRTGLVWRSTVGKMINYRSILKSWERLQRVAGFRLMHGLHGFRHTFATNLLHNGCDIKTLSTLLGHSSIKITLDTYCHVSREQAFNAMMSLRYFG